MPKSSYQLRSDAMPLPVGRGGGATSGGALPAPTFGAMTLGSVFFAGAGGIVSQDNTFLFWDTVLKRLVVGGISLTQAIATAGSPYALSVTGAAHTTLAASVEASDVILALARTVEFAAGALTTQRAVLITPPTYAFVAASTITNAATVAITGAPPAGTNATITNPMALWIQAGNAAFAGNVGFGTTAPTSPAHVIGAMSTTRLIGNSTTPTVAITAAGAGANATASVSGTDLSGTITLNTNVADTPLASSDVLTLTFNTTYASAPRVIFMPSNDSAWREVSVVRLRQADVTTTTFKLRSGLIPFPAVGADTYTYNYMVVQ